MRSSFFAALLTIALAALAHADSITLLDGSKIADAKILSKTSTDLNVSDNGAMRRIALKDVAEYEWRGKTEVLVKPTTRPAAAPVKPSVTAPVLLEQPPAPTPAPPVAPVTAPEIRVYFSPNGGCTDAIVKALDEAKKSIRIQAYSFTSAPIAKAIIDAQKRGVKVTAVLDKSNRSDKYSSATFLKNQGATVLTDDRHAIAHNKVILIDDGVIITGSFNFSKAAEESNAENLLIITGAPALFSLYSQNFAAHLEHSTQYEGMIADTATEPQPVTARPPAPAPTPAPRAAAQPLAPVPNNTAGRTDLYGGRPSGDTTATGLPIYTGPRGGRYHYSKSGKKVYEKRK